MIAYLEGEIVRTEPNLIVLKTSCGVGYAVHVSQQVSFKFTTEKFIALHIYTNVREDDISLYGFQKLEEKELFEMVIKTSGVGPKLGLAVLSFLSPQQLVDAVNQNSSESFSQVSGIGKKTAAKLCLDLKDQLKRHPVTGIDSGLQGLSKTRVTTQGIEIDGIFSALKNLGYSEAEILPVIRETGSSDLSFEDRLKKALSLLTPLR